MIKLMDLLKEYEIKTPSKVKVINYGEDVMEELERLGLFNFEEGLLGSSQVGYYYFYIGQDARDFAGPFNKVKGELLSTTLDKDRWEDVDDEIEGDINDIRNNFFKKYRGTYIIFSDYDNTNCGRIDVDDKNQTITIYALPDNEDGESLLQFSNNGSEVLVRPNFDDYTI